VRGCSIEKQLVSTEVKGDMEHGGVKRAILDLEEGSRYSFEKFDLGTLTTPTEDTVDEVEG
jgi:hypothetical protein